MIAMLEEITMNLVVVVVDLIMIDSILIILPHKDTFTVIGIILQAPIGDVFRIEMNIRLQAPTVNAVLEEKIILFRAQTVNTVLEEIVILLIAIINLIEKGRHPSPNRVNISQKHVHWNWNDPGNEQWSTKRIVRRPDWRH